MGIRDYILIGLTAVGVIIAILRFRGIHVLRQKQPVKQKESVSRRGNSINWLGVVTAILASALVYSVIVDSNRNDVSITTVLLLIFVITLGLLLFALQAGRGRK